MNVNSFLFRAAFVRVTPREFGKLNVCFMAG
jgi:hypothetical protein